MATDAIDLALYLLEYGESRDRSLYERVRSGLSFEIRKLMVPSMSLAMSYKASANAAMLFTEEERTIELAKYFIDNGCKYPIACRMFGSGSYSRELLLYGLENLYELKDLPSKKYTSEFVRTERVAILDFVDNIQMEYKIPSEWIEENNYEIAYIYLNSDAFDLLLFHTGLDRPYDYRDEDNKNRLMNAFIRVVPELAMLLPIDRNWRSIYLQIAKSPNDEFLENNTWIYRKALWMPVELTRSDIYDGHIGDNPGVEIFEYKTDRGILPYVPEQQEQAEF